MKIRVCIVVDDMEELATGFGSTEWLDSEIQEQAICHQTEGGFNGDRILWAEIEIPPPHPTLTAKAEEESGG